MRQLWRLALTAGVVAATAVPLCAQSLSIRSSAAARESVILPVESRVVKRIASAQDAIEQQRWDEASSTLLQIIETSRGTVVPVGPRQYVATERFCQQLLLQFPAEERLRRIDPAAERLWQRWQQTGDRQPLLEIVNEHFPSSLTDDALWELGNIAWREGKATSARVYWTQLLPIPHESPLPGVLRVPQSERADADVLGRLVLCSLYAGDFARAQRELAVFAEAHPNAECDFTEEPSLWVDVLQSQLDRWQPVEGSAAAEHLASGNAVPDAGWKVLAWKVPLPPQSWPHVRRRPALKDRAPLSFFPATDGRHAYVADGRGVRGYELSTGRAAFAEPGGDASAARFYPGFDDNLRLYPSQLTVGVPRYSATVAHGRLLARLGPPLTVSSSREIHGLTSELVALDVETGEGRLEWSVESLALSSEDTRWEFDGTPVVDGNRAYAVLRSRQAQTRLRVVCIELSTSTILWNEPLLTASSPFGEAFNQITHLQLVPGADLLFLSTNLGAIVAIDPRDGTLRWGHSYVSHEEGDPAGASDDRRWHIQPCLYAEGLVFAAPEDSPHLYAFDALSGTPLWRQSLPGGARQLIGCHAGKLYVGGDSLWSLSATTGHVDWVVRSQRGEDAGFGQACLTGRHIYWPRYHAIGVYSRDKGELIDEISLPHSAHGGGGNLLATGDRLLVAGPDYLAAYAPEGDQPPERRGVDPPRELLSKR